jgi:hypothetical protein
MRRKNSFGVKFLKSALFFLAGVAVLAVVLPIIFSFFGPIITALPFETPTNFIVADYVGMFVLFVIGVTLLVYTKRWMWR